MRKGETPLYSFSEKQNKMKVVLLIVAALTTVVVSQEPPKKCETPKVWFGRRMQITPSEDAARLSEIYYDENEESIAIREEDFDEDRREYRGEIFNHKDNVGYRFDNNGCNKFLLNESFPVFGPDGSDYDEGDYAIGSLDKEKDGVVVTVFVGRSERGAFAGEWIRTDEDTCIPVGDRFYRYQMGEEEVSFVRYYNIKLGLPDADVFKPPEICFR